jgi:F-type H+-transporting ATPase subunit epsilon
VPEGVFGVEIVTPERALLTGEATEVVLRTSTGEMTVLNGHTALVGDVVLGLVRIERVDGTIQRVAVHGGFIQVDTAPGAADDLLESSQPAGPLAGMTTRVTMLAGVAELAEEIDLARAEHAKEESTQRVSELRAAHTSSSGDDLPDLDLQQAEQALARAELRVAVAAGTA